MNWPPLSPDLNPVENLLKYVNGMQKRMIDVVKERGDKINK